MLRPVPQLRPRRFRGGPIPQGRNSCAPTSTSTQRAEQTSFQSFPQEKEKTSFSPFPRTFACRSFRVALPTACACRPRDPSAASLPPHIIFCGPPINKKMRAHGIAPRTRKKRRLLAQENARRHAWLTRSCFGRKNLFIDGPHSLLPFFLSLFLQRKRKKKTEANSAGSNTSLGLTSFVLTMYAIGPRASSAETKVAKSTDFCFIFECLPISL